MRPILTSLLSFVSYGIVSSQCYNEISSGVAHIVGKNAENTIFGWGDNENAALGGVPLNSHYSAYSLPNQSDVFDFFCGSYNTFFVKINGALWGIGSNANGCLGINSSVVTITSFTQVGNSNNWKQVSSDFFTVGTKTDGTLWAWGENDGHQMGDGSCCADRLVPGQVGTDNDWRIAKVSGTRSAFALKNNGTLWSWGTNIAGLLGSNVVQSVDYPTQFVPDTDWDKMSTGFAHILVLKTNGTLWAWGSGVDGECGDGLASTYLRSSPHQVISPGTWVNISAGYKFSMGIKSDGTLWGWGRNGYGQLGDGTTTNQSLPEQIGTATNWQSVSCGYYSVAALRTDGSLWTWGDNTYGQLCNGNAAVTSSATPYNVPVAGCSLGVHDFDKPVTLTLSPNPAVESLTVHYDGKTSCDRMTIYDLSGRIIYQTNAIGALQFNVALPVGNLQAGSYVLALEKGGERLVSKVWVKG